MSTKQPRSGGKRKVILLAYYYLPAITSGVQRAVRFAKYLPKYGYPTTVISSSSAGISNLADVLYVPNAETRRTVGRTLDRTTATVQQMLPYNEQLEWVPHAIEAAAQVIRNEGACTVISTSPPIATHIAAFYLKLRFGLKWIADFRDPLVGNPGRARRWARPYDRVLQRCILGYANQVLGVTDSVVESWCRQYPHSRNKFHLLWNGYDPEEAIPSVPNSLRAYRTLSHIGVLYPQRHPYAILAAIDRLTSQGRLNPAEFRLRFLGEIVDEQRFRSNSAVVSLQRKHCLEIANCTISRQTALAEAANSDYLLLLDIDNLDNHGYTVPAKLFDYIRTGRPVIAATSPHSPVDRILPETGIPYSCIHHSDETAVIEEKILKFFDLPPISHKPSFWFLNTFNGERQAESLAIMIDALINR